MIFIWKVSLRCNPALWDLHIFLDISYFQLYTKTMYNLYFLIIILLKLIYLSFHVASFTIKGNFVYFRMYKFIKYFWKFFVLILFCILMLLSIEFMNSVSKAGEFKNIFVQHRYSPFILYNVNFFWHKKAKQSKVFHRNPKTMRI